MGFTFILNYDLIPFDWVSTLLLYMDFQGGEAYGVQTCAHCVGPNSPYSLSYVIV